MSFRFCERRKSRREDQRKGQDQDYRVRCPGKLLMHCGMIEQPDRYHEQDEDHYGNEHGDAFGDAAAIVVMDSMVVGSGVSFLE